MRHAKIGGLLLKFPRKKKIPLTQYQQTGEIPVIDQSKDSWVAGYTDDIEARHESPLPVTVFGDHTRVVKYVGFPFASGADGTQLLFPKDDNVDPTFFYYAISNVDLSNYFYARHFKFLKEQEIFLPPFLSQQRISRILRNYDDLIENNRRRMALLEQAAKKLYREWFIRLRFPGHEHAPIRDGLPEGWNPRTLGDLCEAIREIASPDQIDAETPYIGLEHIPRRSISQIDWGRAEDVTSSKHKFAAGDILFGKIRPYFHKVSIAFVDGVASADAIVIRPKKTDLHSFVLMTVSSDPFVAMAAQTMKEGSKMPRADWKQMQAHKVFLPPSPILDAFNRQIVRITQQLRNLTFQTRKLRTARDRLLPKLMSGEIVL
jgi:type I restriction enzyme S subunit